MFWQVVLHAKQAAVNFGRYEGSGSIMPRTFLGFLHMAVRRLTKTS